MSYGVGPHTAQIPHCYGCGMGRQRKLTYDPERENFHTPQVPQKKDKKKNKICLKHVKTGQSKKSQNI